MCFVTHGRSHPRSSAPARGSGWCFWSQPPPPLFQGAKMIRGCRGQGLHLGAPHGHAAAFSPVHGFSPGAGRQMSVGDVLCNSSRRPLFNGAMGQMGLFPLHSWPPCSIAPLLAPRPTAPSTRTSSPTGPRRRTKLCCRRCWPPMTSSCLTGVRLWDECTRRRVWGGGSG